MSQLIEAAICGAPLVFETDSALFSPDRIDRGTLAMLSRLTLGAEDKVLDLGCGYGVVGIYAAKQIGTNRVWLLDCDPVAVDCARKNAARNGVANLPVILSDGFRQFDETGFTHILSNPPYHANFSVAKHFIEKGFNRLALGGRMWMVTKRRDWYKQKLISIFGGVRIHETDGYFVFEAEKRSARYANTK